MTMFLILLLFEFLQFTQIIKLCVYTQKKSQSAPPFPFMLRAMQQMESMQNALSLTGRRRGSNFFFVVIVVVIIIFVSLVSSFRFVDRLPLS